MNRNTRREFLADNGILAKLERLPRSHVNGDSSSHADTLSCRSLTDPLDCLTAL